MNANNKQDALIIDIDGTITKDALNIPLGYDPRTDRDIFFEKVNNYNKEILKPIHQIVDLINLIYKCSGYKIIFLTAREDALNGLIRKNTFDFLKSLFYFVKPEDLYMRPYNNFDKNYEIKCKILNNEIKKKYNPLFALDDEDNNVEMFRKNGIVVLQVKDVLNDRTN